MKYFTWRPFHLIILVLFVGSSSLFAQIKLPKLISDGAIFQRDTELKIWGWASPQEKIELTENNIPCSKRHQLNLLKE